ncbi:DUF2691 family protein [Bacillus anthracis]|uniref:DUF2691 family protein n=1 Tax=Bacillus anthracis TaxID=1392 RepID=UPI000D373B97|nr:DUF2691 family protein [Bacillus anthracis]PTR88695.1 hypothetical protein DBA57_30545 [Bacillus anthracis]
MKNMGVTFEIPNEYGNYLSDILEPLPTNEFLFDEDRILSGEKLYESSKNNTYYMIFVTLRGFFKEGIIKAVSKYNEFLESDCKIILAVYDCSYVVFWCKDSQLISNMYMQAISKGYENVKYISEEDLIAHKYYIE